MVYIVSAPRNNGKTTFLEEMASKLGRDAVSGVLALSSPKKDQYYAKNIESGETRLLMSDSALLQGPSIGRFSCSQQTFDWVSSFLLETTKSCIVIDEVGRLELQGEGYHRLLKALLGTSKDLYIAVRDQFVEEVIECFGIKDCKIMEVPKRP